MNFNTNKKVKRLNMKRHPLWKSAALAMVMGVAREKFATPPGAT
jgi:hypothetical protein